jgi:hypothetical protein
MEQRPLRLGDTVDDYCPRERRITNHVIVALVGEAIRQTRCTTCEAEHLFKAARLPPRRKKDSPPSDKADPVSTQLVTAQRAGDPPASPQEDAPGTAAHATDPEPPAPVEDTATSFAGESAPDSARDEVWSAHRPLIRATLPRSDTDPPAPRPIPEFTIRQRHTTFRHHQGWHGGNGQPNGFRPSGPGPGQGGPGQGRPGGRRRRRGRGRNKSK